MTDAQNLIAFDVGNTSVKAALRRDGGWQRILRVPTRPVAGLQGRLSDAFPGEEREAVRGARCLACSVRPEATESLRAFRDGMDDTPPELFGEELEVPIPTLVREPEKVGPDRLLLALGAMRQHGSPCIVISAGTAITVDVVNADGCFAGGAIGPGFGLALRALHEGTGLLPLVEPAVPRVGPGKDTEEALQSGVYWFCAAGASALIEQFRMELADEAAPVVCTGSDVELLLRFLPPEEVRHEPELIFNGMAAALERGEGKSEL